MGKGALLKRSCKNCIFRRLCHILRLVGSDMSDHIWLGYWSTGRLGEYILRIGPEYRAQQYIQSIRMHLAALYSTLDGLSRGTTVTSFPVQQYYVELVSASRDSGGGVCINPVTVAMLAMFILYYS